MENKNIAKRAPSHISRNQTQLCYLCGGKGTILYEDLHDALFGVEGRWNFWRCDNGNCQLVWLDPFPAEDELSRIYENYYTHDIKDQERKDASGNKLLHWSLKQIDSMLKSLTLNRRRRKKMDTMYLRDLPPGKVLEVGCGEGSRLARIRDLGWAVVGQDVDRKAIEKARVNHGLTVFGGDLRSLSFEQNSFDAVIMNHVIEHVTDPVALLSECHRILKLGGILISVTPNIESLGHSHFKCHWLGLDPPRHLFLFSRKTLDLVVRMAGFTKVRIWTSAARAQSFARGSFDISSYGRHIMGSKSVIRTETLSMLFQLVSLLVYALNHGSGEECVAKAIK
jgi:2-polyprenyl-3-methyl-5-hydroxy-6-metoxy-1,4-benzoquinol methylase